MSASRSRRRSANGGASTSNDADAMDVFPPIVTLRPKPSALQPDDDAQQDAAQMRRGSSTSTHSHGLTPEAMSPRVVRFSSGEVQMYANWFHIDVDTTKQIVMQCKGNRDNIVVALTRYRDALQQQGARPPQEEGSIHGATVPSSNPDAASPAQAPHLPSVRSSSSYARQRNSACAMQAPLQATAEASLRDNQGNVSLPASPPRRVASSRSMHPPDAAGRTDLARQSRARLSLSEHRGHTSSDYTIGGGGPPTASSSRQSYVGTGGGMGLVAMLDDVSHQGGTLSVFYAFLVGLLKEEGSGRQWIVDRERTDVLRMWRTSLVGARQIATSAQETMSMDERLAREVWVAREDRMRYRLQVAASLAVQEALARDAIAVDRRNDLIDMRGSAFTDALHTTRRVVYAAEGAQRQRLCCQVFVMGADLVAVRSSETHARGLLESQQFCFLTSAKRDAARIAALVCEVSLKFQLMATVEASFRGVVLQHEAKLRMVLLDLEHHMRVDAFRCIHEPYARQRLVVEEASERAAMAAMMASHREYWVPLIAQERDVRAASIYTQEANAWSDIDTLATLHRIKARHRWSKLQHEQQEVAPQLTFPLDAISCFLLSGLESAERKRIERQYLALPLPQ